ncbi:MAG: hypothetical protein M1319_05095 [Chloroflexi bacterium]|nr:hypothetical protein [Chloroflexota bacterium]
MEVPTIDEERVSVECYSGSAYAERPVSFMVGSECHAVKRITKYWREPGLLGFSVISQQGGSYHLVYYEQLDTWVLRRRRRGVNRSGDGAQPEE